MHMPRIPARVTLAPLVLASCLLSSSCCGLYELWGCGPQQPLVPISFDSPRQALDSFRAAIRYQDSNVLYRCMSEEFKEEQGFDALSFAIFWDKLIEREPAIPALGDARIVATRWLSAREKLFTLETYGQKVRVSFSSTPSYEYGELSTEPAQLARERRRRVGGRTGRRTRRRVDPAEQRLPTFPARMYSARWMERPAHRHKPRIRRLDRHRTPGLCGFPRGLHVEAPSPLSARLRAAGLGIGGAGLSRAPTDRRTRNFGNGGPSDQQSEVRLFLR
jgi:hypothetical protein